MKALSNDRHSSAAISRPTVEETPDPGNHLSQTEQCFSSSNLMSNRLRSAVMPEATAGSLRRRRRPPVEERPNQGNRLSQAEQCASSSSLIPDRWTSEVMDEATAGSSSLGADRRPTPERGVHGADSSSDDESSMDEFVAWLRQPKSRLLASTPEDSPRLISLADGHRNAEPAREVVSAELVDRIVAEALEVAMRVQSQAPSMEADVPATGLEGYASSRMTHFRSMADVIGRLMQEARISLGREDVHQLGMLKDACRRLQELARGGLTATPGRRALHQRVMDHLTSKHAGGAHLAEAQRRASDLLRGHELTQAEGQAQRALAVVLKGCLPTVLDELRDTGALYQLAQDMLAELRRTGGPNAISTSPAFAHAQAQTLLSIQRDMQLAGAECGLQKGLLQTLGRAAAELGQAKVEGLRGSINHAARSLLGSDAVHLLGGDGRPGTEQVRASLQEHLGEFLVFDVIDQTIRARLKEDAPGSLSGADLERKFSELLHVNQPGLIASVVHQAVQSSPDYEQVLVQGRQSVRLKPRAVDRLAELNRACTAQETTPEEKAVHRSLLHSLILAAQDLPHAVLDTVLHIHHERDAATVRAEPRDEWADRHPDELIGHLNQQLHVSRDEGNHVAVGLLEGLLRHNVHLEAARDADGAPLHVRRRGTPPLPSTPARVRLADVSMRAQQAAQLTVLKLSLLQSFAGPIAARAQTANESVPWHQGLRQAKDELLAGALEDLMRCSAPGQMELHLDRVQAEHDKLLRDNWKRPDGGRTAEFLHDLRTAVERF